MYFYIQSLNIINYYVEQWVGPGNVINDSIVKLVSDWLFFNFVLSINDFDVWYAAKKFDDS